MYKVSTQNHKYHFSCRNLKCPILRYFGPLGKGIGRSGFTKGAGRARGTPSTSSSRISWGLVDRSVEAIRFRHACTVTSTKTSAKVRICTYTHMYRYSFICTRASALGWSPLEWTPINQRCHVKYKPHLRNRKPDSPKASCRVMVYKQTPK